MSGSLGSVSSFFRQSTSSGPLINGIQYFQTRFRFSEEIRVFKKPRGEQYTANSNFAPLGHSRRRTQVTSNLLLAGHQSINTPLSNK